MINLLPPEQKRQIRASISNVLLLRYCIVTVLLAVMLLLSIGAVYLIMKNSKEAAELAISESTAKSASYQKIQQGAEEFKKNLSTAKTILDKEVRYSEIAVKIAQALPPGIVLESLQLDAKTFGQATTLSAKGKSYSDAIRLKTAMENSPMFENAHLQSVTQGSEGDYPVSILISVVINPEIAK